MTHHVGIGLVCLLVACDVAAMGVEPVNGRVPPRSGQVAPGPVERMIGIMDAVREHHIEPHTRMEMTVAGLVGVRNWLEFRLLERIGPAVDLLFGKRAASRGDDDRRPQLIEEASAKSLEEAFVVGLFSSVPGGAQLMSAKERVVAEQIEGNRYVGIQVALKYNSEIRLPQILDVMKDGPADKAGVKADDLIERIDDIDIKGMNLADVIDRIRGADGTYVTLSFRQPRDTKSRTLSIKRGQLPHATVNRADVGRSNGAVACVKINEISASTAHELCKLASQLEGEGKRAVVLDLRAAGGATASNPHFAVLLADLLLEQGVIGRIRTVHGERAFEATTDAVFRGWPMAVVVDGSTAGLGEWLAAALQDNRRAVIIGTRTASGTVMKSMAPSGAFGTSANFVRHRSLSGAGGKVNLGDGSQSISFVTGLLLRADGSSLRGRQEIQVNTHTTFRHDVANSPTVSGGVMPDIDLSLKGSKRVARQRVAVARREAAEPPQDAKSGVAPLAGNRPRDPIPIAIDTLEKQLATLAE